MVETVYDVCLPSMLTMTFPTKPYSSFFLLGNLLLCNCKYENLMIKSQSEPNQSYSPWGALSTMSSKTAPIIVSFVVICNEGVLIMVIGLGGVQFRLVQSQV